jgi:hypothetical protein
VIANQHQFSGLPLRRQNQALLGPVLLPSTSWQLCPDAQAGSRERFFHHIIFFDEEDGAMTDMDDPLAAVRGIMYGTCLGAMCWALIILFLWWLL